VENIEKNLNTIPHNFTLETFARAKDKMIATNNNAYGRNNSTYWLNRERLRDYSSDDVHRIINMGSQEE
jgi:hypothetical protein